MGQRMSMDLGLDTCPGRKMKFRWMFNIPDVCGGAKSGGASALPPSRSARPSLTFREMEARHLNETIYYPAKAEWKPITITLYDLSTGGNHPVWKWLKAAYDPKAGTWKPCVTDQFIKEATLKMLDGCGNTTETWTFENAWPQVTEFGELDMGSSEVVTCDITLRYARAYVT